MFKVGGIFFVLALQVIYPTRAPHISTNQHE